MQYRIPAILTLVPSMLLVSVANAQSRSTTRASAAPTFQQMPGALTQISVACGVWGVNTSGQAVYYNEVNHDWVGGEQSNVGFSQVAAGGSDSFNDAWALTALHVPYGHGVTNSFDGSRSTSSWDRMSWPPLLQITSDNYNVWGLDESNRIFRYMKSGRKFVQIPGSLVQVATLAGNGYLDTWGLDAAHHIYKFTDAVGGHGTFEPIPGELIQITVGRWVRPTEVWGINAAHQIYRYNDKASSFEQVPGTLAQIAAGIDGVWGINDSGEIYRFKESTNSFQQVPGNLKQISLAPGCDDGVWGINSKNQVFRLSVPTDVMQYNH